MRNKRTQAEAEAVVALEYYLAAHNYGNPVEIEDWVDQPDVIFKTEAGRVACEIATVVPSSIIQWYFKKLPQLHAAQSREIIFPAEPHEWASKILHSKNTKIDAYKRNSKSNKIWLLLHSPDKESNLLNPVKNEEIELMKYAAHTVKHNFKKVLFFDRNGPAIELFDFRHKENIEINYSFIEHGYPTYVMRTVLLGAIAGIRKGLYSELELDFNKIPVGHTITLEPLDKMYRKKKPRFSFPVKNPKIIISNDNERRIEVDSRLIFPDFYDGAKQ